MTRNTRQVRFILDAEKAEELKGKLEKWQEDTKETPIISMLDSFKIKNIRNYRLIELFINLLPMAPPDKRPAILKYVKELDDETRDMDKLSLYADIYAAVKGARVKNDTDDRAMVGDTCEI